MKETIWKLSSKNRILPNLAANPKERNGKPRFDRNCTSDIEVLGEVDVLSEPEEPYHAILPGHVHPGVTEAASLIHSYCNAEYIYLFGQRTGEESFANFLNAEYSRKNHVHFYFLVVTRNMQANIIADTSDYVRTHAGFSVEVTILMHKPADVLYAREKYLYFFQSVFQNAILVFKNEKSLEFEIPGTFTRDYAAARKYWKNRQRISAIFLEASGADTSDEGLAGIAMLQIAMEHILLGLIEVYLGYRPKHFALGYLLDICCYCTDELPLARTTEEDKKVFRALCTGLSALRHSENKTLELTLTELLHERCGRMHDRIVTKVETYLNKLDSHAEK